MQYLLLLLLATICLPAFSQTITVKDVVDRMVEDQQTPIQKGSVDTLIVGGWDQPVHGIAITFMATFDVIKRAQRNGLNLVLTHEPTFYNHLDLRDDYGRGDSVVTQKIRFIEEHDMVVLRYHDLPHQASVDMINAGFVEQLGWQDLDIGDWTFSSPFKTLGDHRIRKGCFGNGEKYWFNCSGPRGL